MSSAVNPISSSTMDPTTPKPATDPNDSLANEQVFLQLLVAQLKNQDPLQPQDGLQFVSQLAQFSNLEQSVQSRTDLDGILAQLKTSAVATPPATQDTTTQGTSGTSSSDSA